MEDEIYSIERFLKENLTRFWEESLEIIVIQNFQRNLWSIFQKYLWRNLCWNIWGNLQNNRWWKFWYITGGSSEGISETFLFFAEIFEANRVFFFLRQRSLRSSQYDNWSISSLLKTRVLMFCCETIKVFWNTVPWWHTLWASLTESEAVTNYLK